MKQGVLAKWKQVGKKKVILPEDIYCFRFYNPIDEGNVIEEGSSHMASKVLTIKPWSLQVEKERGKNSTILCGSNFVLK